MPSKDAGKQEWIKKLREELNEYEIGGYDLDQVFEPLFDVCDKVAKNENEFKQCMREAISTLKSVMNRVKY